MTIILEFALLFYISEIINDIDLRRVNILDIQNSIKKEFKLKDMLINI